MRIRTGFARVADGYGRSEGVSPSDLRVGDPVVDAAEAERREAAERANEIKALTKLVIVGAVLTLRYSPSPCCIWPIPRWCRIGW